MRALLMAGVVAFGWAGVSHTAQANPIYVGYSLDGGATIIQPTGSGADGYASFSVKAGGFQIQVSGTGAPITDQGTLLSNSTTVDASTAGTISIYVSEIGNMLTAGSFTTGFGNNSLSTVNVMESTYATAGNTPFATQNLLAARSVAPGEPMVNATSAAPAGLGNLFTLTSIYTITYGPGGGKTTSTLNLEATPLAVPEPASLALLGAGLIGVGALRRRKSV